MPNDNDIIIGVSMFCTKCTTAIRPATCDDMNGDMIDCPRCQAKMEGVVGLSVVAKTAELLQFAYVEMQKNKQGIKEFLSERNPT